MILTLGVESRDKDLGVAKANNDSSAKKVLALARNASIEPKNIQTSALTMGPEYSEERIPKFLAYRVSQTIAITVTDLSKYEDLMTGALKAGVNQVYGVSFTLADPKKYRQEAHLKAIRAAREKATAKAAELGEKLAKPLGVDQEGDSDFEPRDRFVFAAGRNQMDQAIPGAGEGLDATIAGGDVTVRAFVRVTFQLE